MKFKVRFERTLIPTPLAIWLMPILSIISAFICGAILLAAVGADPLKTYKAMLLGAFGTKYNLSETIVKTIPLLLCGLAVSIAFKMRLWNIGAEGQLMMGAFAASGVALFLSNQLPGITIPMMILSGFIAGALWAAIPALLKSFFKVNEIITTLMANYIAILWIRYLFYGPWRDPKGFGFPGTAIFPKSAWLPRLPGTRIHLGLLFGLVIAMLLYLVFKRMKWGYEIKVIGESAKAARYAGMDIGRNIILVMLLSGGIAGLAGMSEVAGIYHRLQQGINVGYGYTAIIIAWLARLNPRSIILVSFLMAGLFVGGDQIQIAMKLSSSIAPILQGTILFFVLAGELLTCYRIRLER